MVAVVIDDATQMPRADLLSGLRCVSDLEESRVYFSMRVVYSVGFVFFTSG